MYIRGNIIFETHAANIQHEETEIMKRIIEVVSIIMIICLVWIFDLQAQLNWDMAMAGDVGKILIERERAEVYNEILQRIIS